MAHVEQEQQMAEGGRCRSRRGACSPYLTGLAAERLQLTLQFPPFPTSGDLKIAVRRAHTGADVFPSPARTRRRYRRLALPRPGQRPRRRSCGRLRADQGKQRWWIGFSGCRWLPVWLPGGGQAPRHLPGSQFCLVNPYPPAHPQGGASDWV